MITTKNFWVGLAVGFCWALVLLVFNCSDDEVTHSGPDVYTSVDTLYLTGPTNYVDRWHEKIRYITQQPDTVTVVVYDQAPPTVSFVKGTISEDGTAFIEVLVNETTSIVLSGQLALSGDTEIIVNPDSTLTFVTQRLGFDPSLAIGYGTSGIQLSFETFYMNNIPLLNTTIHGPNISAALDTEIFSDTSYVEDCLSLGTDVSIEVFPFKSPSRVNLGAMYDFNNHEIVFNAAFTLELYDF